MDFEISLLTLSYPKCPNRKCHRPIAFGFASDNEQVSSCEISSLYNFPDLLPILNVLSPFEIKQYSFSNEIDAPLLMTAGTENRLFLVLGTCNTSLNNNSTTFFPLLIFRRMFPFPIACNIVSSANLTISWFIEFGVIIHMSFGGSHMLRCTRFNSPVIIVGII